VARRLTKTTPRGSASLASFSSHWRGKYDAAKTLKTFSARLRDKTNLDAPSDDLVGGGYGGDVQPSHITLWLRPDTASKGKQTSNGYAQNVGQIVNSATSP
jgi:hypothetical protein